MPDRLRTNWRVTGPLLGFLVVTLVLACVVFRYFLLTFTVAASVALMLSSVQGALSRRLGNAVNRERGGHRHQQAKDGHAGTKTCEHRRILCPCRTFFKARVLPPSLFPLSRFPG